MEVRYSFFNLGARRQWVVKATPRPFYPRVRAGTHCIGGWVGPRVGLDGCGKSLPHRNSIPWPSSPQRVAIPTALSQPTRNLINIYKHARRHIPEYCENFILCRSTNSLARHPKCCFFTVNCIEHEFWIRVVWNACAATNQSVLVFWPAEYFLIRHLILYILRRILSFGNSDQVLYLNSVFHLHSIISIQIFSSYCAVNALKQVNIEQRNSGHLFWEPHKIHKFTLLVEGRFCNTKQNGTCSIIYHDAMRTRQLGLQRQCEIVGIVISCPDGPGLEYRPVQLLPCRSFVGVFHSTSIQIIEG